ncbi:MAG: nodulation protein NfeD [Armatimonadota bacterium]|nr:nodulation protein NfeD [Armatimonadota bacterium]MDR5698166.1 nodulation protein NfeD [Armatimonadota bacterium]
MGVRLSVLALILAFGAAVASAAPERPVVYVIRVDGVISPASATYIQRAITEAHRAGAAALVVELDTPGGLLRSTDDITKALLNAPLPVIVYVSPAGARAASAGVFVVYASHVAAMAPTTNLGAATPIAVGEGQETESQRTALRKATEDSVAKIRTIAERRGRNADWAERAIREAASISSEEAVRLRVIDFLAADLAELLVRADGRTVEVGGERRLLRTRGAETVRLEMDVRERLLDVLAEPNVGLILMTIAIYGIIFELNNPGAIFPGVVGAIALILAFTSFAILQVNYAGLALIGLSVALFITELFTPGFGVLGVGGIISFILGGILLTSNQEPYLRTSVELVLVLGLLTGAFFLFAVGAGLRAQRRRPSSGREALVGAVGVARSEIAPAGTVFVQGELWTAEADGDPIQPGERVRVVGLEGLRLRVRREGERS